MNNLLCFVFGLYLGSFLHVMAYRMPKGYYFVPARSCCENCGKELTWRELIPIFSYLVQKGRCKQCKIEISILHPISEFVFAVLLLVLHNRFYLSADFIFAFLFISVLFVLSISDIYYYILPNKMIIFLFIIIFIWKLQIPDTSVKAGLLGIIFSFIFLGILLYITNGGMGMGDYKLFATLAYFFESYLFLKLLVLSSLFALIYFFFLYSQKKLRKESYIFFGPFISIAAYILLLYSY